jgi:hypothetical protein
LRRRASIPRSAMRTAALTFALSRGRRGRTVVSSKVLVSAARIGWPPWTSLEIVAHDRSRHPAQEGQCIDVRPNPIRQRLARTRLGVGVVRRPQDGDEDFVGASAGANSLRSSPASSSS